MDLYQQHILEHYKDPINYGEIEGADLVRAEYNPICGDKIIMYLKLEDKLITDVSFTGEGCAISIASASLLTDEIKGKSIEDVKKMTREDVLDLLGIELNPGRLKCGLLGFICLEQLIG